MRMFIIALSACVGVAIVAPVAPAAQSIAPGIAGTWSLDSEAAAARSRRPVTGLSTATRLVVRQSPDAITVDANTGTGNAIVSTTYRLDGSEHPIPGPIGWDTRAKSTWDGTKLVVSIRRAVQGPDGELAFDILETYAAVQDTLTVERRQGRTVETLVYKRN